MLGRWQGLRYATRKIGLRPRPSRRLSFAEQFSLAQADLANRELAAKHPAFFYANSPGCDVAFQAALPVHRHGLSNDLSRHPAFDFDVLNTHGAKAMNISFAIHHQVSSADTTGNFA